ncbi:MAG: hypothetical protein IKN04_03370 [Clostridia bacterium]|nr:hypothetical protein [Clostridia bacterium]
MPELTFLHRDIEFDELHPEDSIRTFVAFATEVLSRYNFNKTMITECDDKQQDILHFIELSDNLNAKEGYKKYKQLADIRRERRKCKLENELLEQVFQFFNTNKAMLDQLKRIQGTCRKEKDNLSNLRYNIRTNILSE